MHVDFISLIWTDSFWNRFAADTLDGIFVIFIDLAIPYSSNGVTPLLTLSYHSDCSLEEKRD